MCKPHKHPAFKHNPGKWQRNVNRRIQAAELDGVPKPHEIEEDIHPAELRLIEYEAAGNDTLSD